MSQLKQSERRELWRQRVAQQEKSGQTVRVFCSEHKLSEHSFYWWQPATRLLRKAHPICIRLVETTTPTEMHRPGQARIELFLASGERLHIPADEATVRLVLSALREQK